MNKISIQNHYNLVTEGRSNKTEFLKQARKEYPGLLTQFLSFDASVNILKNKNILNESKVVVKETTEDWKEAFQKFITEAKEPETPSKEVLDIQSHSFDNKDKKNIDNYYGQSFLNGYYCEMKDPANEDKTVDELKAIVLKNMASDRNWYAKNAMFGTKVVGFTDEAPSLGKSKEIKGKFKSSGYGNEDEAKVKSNVKTTLGKQEAYTTGPKKVKEMAVAPKPSNGIKKMDVPGKSKTIRVKPSTRKKPIINESKKNYRFKLNESNPDNKNYYKDRGFNDFGNGKKLSDNPFKLRKHQSFGLLLYNEWIKGWKEAEQHLRDAEDEQSLKETDSKRLNQVYKYNQPEYKYYVIDNNTKKIISGWEFREDAQDFKKEKLEGSEFPKNRIVVYSLQGTKILGLDPENDTNWGKDQLNEFKELTSISHDLEKVPHEKNLYLSRGKALPEPTIAKLKAAGYDVKPDLEDTDNDRDTMYYYQIVKSVGSLNESSEDDIAELEQQLLKEKDPERKAELESKLLALEKGVHLKEDNKKGKIIAYRVKVDRLPTGDGKSEFNKGYTSYAKDEFDIYKNYPEHWEPIYEKDKNWKEDSDSKRIHPIQENKKFKYKLNESLFIKEDLKPKIPFKIGEEIILGSGGSGRDKHYKIKSYSPKFGWYLEGLHGVKDTQVPTIQLRKNYTKV